MGKAQQLYIPTGKLFNSCLGDEGMIGLTDEQIDTLFEKLKLEILAERKVKRHWWLFPFLWTWELLRDVILLNIETSNAIRDAQFKKVVEWGNEVCSEHYHGVQQGAYKRRDCDE